MHFLPSSWSFCLFVWSYFCISLVHCSSPIVGSLPSSANPCVLSKGCLVIFPTQCNPHKHTDTCHLPVCPVLQSFRVQTQNYPLISCPSSEARYCSDTALAMLLVNAKHTRPQQQRVRPVVGVGQLSCVLRQSFLPLQGIANGTHDGSTKHCGCRFVCSLEACIHFPSFQMEATAEGCVCLCLPKKKVFCLTTFARDSFPEKRLPKENAKCAYISGKLLLKINSLLLTKKMMMTMKRRPVLRLGDVAGCPRCLGG